MNNHFYKKKNVKELDINLLQKTGSVLLFIIVQEKRHT
jgi:hypothetical protein